MDIYSVVALGATARQAMEPRECSIDPARVAEARAEKRGISMTKVAANFENRVQSRGGARVAPHQAAGH